MKFVFQFSRSSDGGRGFTHLKYNPAVTARKGQQIMTKRKHTTTQEKLKMPTKHHLIIKSQNTPNQGTPKK